jgi:IstB-like ATP binding protein
LLAKVLSAEVDDWRFPRLVNRYGRLDLLCLDELGYVQLDTRGAELPLQIITEREEKASVAMAATCRSANGPRSSPTPASSPPSSTASPSTPTSSRPAPKASDYEQAEHPKPNPDKPTEQMGPKQASTVGPIPVDKSNCRCVVPVAVLTWILGPPGGAATAPSAGRPFACGTGRPASRQRRSCESRC